MSIIRNTQIQRGDKITSSDLNQQFTDVNSAFPLGEINFAQESVDLPHFNTENNSGKSDIILKNIGSWGSSPNVTIQANTVTTPPFLSATVLHTQSVFYDVEPDDILRVYWHLNVEPAGNNTIPIGSNANGLCWVAWLEWDIGSGYVPVPNQVDMIQGIQIPSKYGANVENMNACTLIQHVQIHSHSGSTDYYFGEPFSVYGQWFYKSNSSVDILGLRLVARGMFEPTWITAFNKNAVQIVQSTSSHSCDVNQVQLSYIQMRSK